VSWSTRFDDPIDLPNGRKLVTLKDAATYIMKLSKAEHTVAGLAGCDGGSDPGGRSWPPDDVRADWGHAGAEPAYGKGVQSRPQGSSLGKAEAEERPIAAFE